MKIELKKWLTGEVIFSHEAENNTIRLTLEVGIKTQANLSRADLSGADLSGAYLSLANLSLANLSRAYLSGANLSGANLSLANLSGANLSRANLSGAYLSRAYLSGAYLSGADLSGANLSRADLSRADLSRAYLSGADLSRADYMGIKIKNIPTQILNLRWPILIFENHMQIGCKFHTHKEWSNFSDDEISAMDSEGLQDWKKYKTVLMEMCKLQQEDI
jgi:hypothetical protein